jgi:beta-lactamase superfamily II metal-dependent hydrolase
MIDAGSMYSVNHVEDILKRLNIDRLNKIILTHYDPDHTAALMHWI